jgi:hypothetical protein
MLSTKRNLRAASAVVILLGLGLAASCRGFFPKATLQTIALQPPTPTFGVGVTQTMQAWGTDSNNNRYQLTSGVEWQLSEPSSGTVATINEQNGSMVGVNAGTITVTASSEGLSGTTTATVVEAVSSMTITPGTNSVPDDGATAAEFTVSGASTNGTQDITSLVTLTAYQNGTPQSGITCTYDSVSNTQQCIADVDLVTTSTQFTILVTYGGYTGSAQVTAILTVNPTT